MEYRNGIPADLAHLETFVWQAIFPAFDHPDLTEEQRAVNDKVVEEARTWAVRAMGREDELLYVAQDNNRKQLAGLIWAKGGHRPRVVLIVVARRYWGGEVASKLLEEAIFWMGAAQPIDARVREYNQRAIAFFSKHGFTITEEKDEDFPISRIVMRRPAAYQAEADNEIDQLDLGFELPEPEPEPRSAAEEQLNLAEPYAQRRNPDDQDQSLSKFPHIELEIDSGSAGDTSEDDYASREAPEESAAAVLGDDTPPFEFAFQSATDEAGNKNDEAGGPLDEELNYEPAILDALADEDESGQPELVEDALVLEEIDDLDNETVLCTNCGSVLPEGAKFCPQCGHPVEEPHSEVDEESDQRKSENSKQASPFESREQIAADNNRPVPGVTSPPAGPDEFEGIDWNGSLMSDFRALFKELFHQRVQDYFGESAVARYESARRQSEFKQTVSTQLAALADWVRNNRSLPAWQNKLGYDRLLIASEALIEFFLVEEAKNIHGGIWPQRLLRHQTSHWGDVDLFSLVMDYLDFSSEEESIYTDFVRMPARVLRNVTNRYLSATMDERVLFVCDQSLLGNGKDGYAMTDVAIYWRPVLQGPHRLLYQDIDQLSIKADHLNINGLFFDAGKSLNFKMALLLRRLSTLIATYAA